MAKGAATEAQLAALHRKIAEVLTAQLGETICVNPEDVEGGAEEDLMYVASPALLTMAARFVKDSGVEMEVEASDTKSKISERIEAIKSKRGKIVRLSDIHPVDEAL